MVQCLAEQGNINALWLQRRFLNITMPKLQVVKLVFLCLALAEVDNTFGVINTDNFACVACQQLTQKSLP